MATCSRDKTIYIYEIENEDMVQGQAPDQDFEFSVSNILSGHTQDVKFVKWHPTENLLFSASYDNTIKCWAYSDAVDDWLCEYTI